MKKIILCALMSVVCFATASAAVKTNKSTIKVKFDGLTTDTIIVQTYYTSKPEKAKSDTVVMKNNWYTMTVADDYAVNVMFGEKPKLDPRGWTMDEITQLTVLPGEKITVTGGIKNGKAVIKGSAYADEEKQLKALLKDTDDEMQKLIDERSAKLKAEGEANEEKIIEEYTPQVKEISAKRNAIIKSYVATHPASPVSAYYAGYDMFEGNTMMPLLSDKAYNGPMKYYLEQMKKYKAENDARKAKAEELAKATVAKDFTAKDLNGNDLTLSSLYNKGKFTLLDFWGSWCHWCLKAIPKLKAVYEPHQDKLQVLSVDCNDTVEKWKKAVEEHQLTWFNVKSEKDNDIAEMYGIQGYPTFIVISPEGKILKVQVGTDDEFYKWLEETITK